MVAGGTSKRKEKCAMLVVFDAHQNVEREILKQCKGGQHDFPKFGRSTPTSFFFVFLHFYMFYSCSIIDVIKRSELYSV